MIALLLPLLRRGLPVLVALAALAGALGWAYLEGRTSGRAGVLAQWDAERAAQLAARETARQETARRMSALTDELERLRARPARIKEILRTVHVKADDRCSSLPDSVRRLWDAADSGAD